MVIRAIHTPTLDDYVEAIEHLINVEKILWSGGNANYKSGDRWYNHFEETCIGVNDDEDGSTLCLRYGSISCYKEIGCPIITMEEFRTIYKCNNLKKLLKDFK